ncbi:Uu.00g105800.m01.CDS01 [Anthostomella pinea]|uniref:Uu.00g105800.m01.CDS01 n=1 Tax=Anthostomella pinea TaxID=933095 RepID=A0AAI8VDW1_9PEZI|nr:Uu.00g105800.m01.CDS01 [Anthostomella pinea]
MSETEVQASVLHGVRDLRTETRRIAAPGADELQIAVKSTGICGSDQHYFNHFRNGDIQVREPMALGHESAGVVEAVGSNHTGSFKAGDRVALEVGLPCEECDLCKAGRYNICRQMQFRSSAKAFPHFQGTLQERINHPAKWCHKLPDPVTLDEGALLEPLSVAIHAVRRAKVQPGVNSLVLGAGAVGLLTAAMLRVEKAGKITIADIEGRRVEFAKQNGFADVGVTVPRTRPKSDAIEDKLALAQETAKVLTEGAFGNTASAAIPPAFDVVFECTGVEACVQASIYATAPGGAIMLIGMGTPIQTLPMSAAALREIDIRGVFRYASTYQYGLELLADREKSGLPDISKLATHRFGGLDRVVDAFQMAGKPVDDEGKLVLKVVIET